MSDGQVQRLRSLREELGQIPAQPWSGIESWVAKATPVIRSDWLDFLDDFREVVATPKWTRLPRAGGNETYNSQATAKEQMLNREKAESAQQAIMNFLDGLMTVSASAREDSDLDKVIFLCRRFPLFARQLGTRQRGKPPLDIKDEYDVQYLILALLRLHFDDVRSEVWTPPYAGSSSRMDFLLKPQGIVVEAKKTRETLLDKDIGNQLIIDIERYAQFQDCKTLVCFVYDPDKLLDNPGGLAQDLSGPRKSVNVVVLIAPTDI